jgi:hypothetical protein
VEVDELADLVRRQHGEVSENIKYVRTDLKKDINRVENQLRGDITRLGTRVDIASAEHSKLWGSINDVNKKVAYSQGCVNGKHCGEEEANKKWYNSSIIRWLMVVGTAIGVLGSIAIGYAGGII